MISCSRGDGGSKQVTISISPKNEIILIGDELQYTAVVTGLSDQRVSWSATGGEIDENGLYRATELGTFDVIATSKADPTKTAKTKVYVVAVKAFDEIKAWQGSITWKYNVSWSDADEISAYNHLYQEDITLEYRLDEQEIYDKWYRHPDSSIEVSGSLHYLDEQAPGGKFYLETKWNGQFTFVPESRAKSDYLEINEETGTYSFYLRDQSINPSPIITRYYDSGEEVENWKNWGYGAVLIENQPLPLVGTTLSGTKVEKLIYYPSWGPQDGKETELTITWKFTPVE